MIYLNFAWYLDDEWVIRRKNFAILLVFEH